MNRTSFSCQNLCPSLRWLACGFCLATLVMCLPTRAQNVEYLPGIEWPEPQVVTPGKQNSQAPSDAVILFNGTDLSAWEGGENWKVEDGIAIIGTGEIKTKQHFGDCQLHIEWSAPAPPQGKGQLRGNSGVYMMNKYEIQILDSYQNPTYFEGQAGAVYKQTPPLVNAMRPPGEWNTYDILWTSPQFDENDALKSPAYVTVIHNGVVVHNHFELLGTTRWHKPSSYEVHPERLPIKLQDHGNPVRFRNIWIREVKSIVGKQVRKPSYIDHDSGKTWKEGEAPVVKSEAH